MMTIILPWDPVVVRQVAAGARTSTGSEKVLHQSCLPESSEA